MTDEQSVQPLKVVAIENVWITLSDGCRLAARIWMPEAAEAVPVPAILEYVPYGKRDFTRQRDESIHPWFAAHGYAAIRVDMRGGGDSKGILQDEYLLQEQDDAIEVIAWIARQPWCTGNIGMMGKSWGAFNSLQVAARRPPELKAIIAVMGTDDRFAEDIHYSGGCLLGESLTWGAFMQVLNARPPDPVIVGPRWSEMWLERLDAETFWPETWLQHQTRDAYWQHGSVCTDYCTFARSGRDETTSYGCEVHAPSTR
jgi:putative CocE/NonD family hydrolase